MVNKASLTQSASRASGLSLREASACIDSILDAIAGGIGRGEKVELRGLGSFSVRKVAARKTALSNNAAVVPAHGKVTFRPCQKLRESVWGKAD